jgi:hypothetical protein
MNSSDCVSVLTKYVRLRFQVTIASQTAAACKCQQLQSVASTGTMCDCNGPATASAALFDAVRTQLNAIAADSCGDNTTLGLHENMAQLRGQTSTLTQGIVDTVQVNMCHSMDA